MGHIANPTMEQWPFCGDTGTSSEAIYQHFRFGTIINGERDAPSDPSDFARCFRLLSQPWAIEWRARIAEMAQYKSWSKKALAWDELEALYLEESAKSMKAPRLYARMRELAVYGVYDG